MSNSGAFRSLHCLIYKVLAPSAQRRNICYFSRFISVCQVLFSTFFKFFSTLIRTDHPLRQLDYFTKPSSFCQALFSAFSKLFSLRYRSSSTARDSLLNIPDTSLFVNTFFSSFSIFFLSPSPHPSYGKPPALSHRRLWLM